ncbi:MAG: DUF4382 domain-containing protein [Gemmatimonadales bacterium]|nr:DUF4382 domain-containing protein [Gemmatimonadales bacterium]
MKQTLGGNYKALLILIFGLALGLLVGCSGDGDLLSPDDTAVMNVPLDKAGNSPRASADDAVAFDDIILVVTEISIYRASDDSEDGWYSLDIWPTEYNLQDLTLGISALIADIESPAGTYDQIRLLLSEGSYIVIDGQSFDLFIPSGLSRGIQIQHDFEIIEGEEYSAALEVDAAGSVKVTGKERYTLQPVLIVQETVIDTNGTIIGVVIPVDAEAWIWTMVGSEMVSTYADLETGEFTLWPIPAGTYTLNFVPKEGTYPQMSLTDIEVIAGETTDIDVINLFGPVK